MFEQDFFKQVVAVSPHIMYIYDLEEEAIVYTNQHCEDFLGLSSDALRDMGNSYFETVLHPDSVEESRNRFKQFSSLKDGEAIEFEQRVKHNSGEWRWAQSKEVVFKRKEDGSVWQVLGVSQDITELKTAQESFRVSEAKLKAIFYSSNKSMFVLDENCNILKVNDVGLVDVENLRGKRPQIGDSMLAYINEKYQDLFKSEFKKARAGEIVTGNREIVTPSGELKRFEVELEPVFDDHKVIWGVLFSALDVTEKRNTELSLEQSNMLLKESQRMAGLGSWVFDFEQQKMEWSEQMYDIFEWQGANSPDWNQFFQHIHQEDRIQINRNLDSLLWDPDTADTEDSIYRYITPEEKCIYFNSYTEVQRDKNGRIIRLMGCCQDVTEQVQTEKALRESEDKIRLIVENAGVIMLTLTPKGKFTYVSPSSNKVAKYNPEQMIGLHFSDIVHRDDANRVHEAVQKILETKQPQSVSNYRVIHPHKQWRWHSLTLTASLDTNGEITQLIGVARDVTERVETEKELKISRERWNYALEGSQDGVWDANLKEHTVFYSKMWKQMLGYKEHEIEHRYETWEELLYQDDKERVLAEVNQHFKGETEYYTTEYRLRCKDGSFKWVLARGKVIERSTDGQPIRFIGVHTDISRQKMMESHLREAQQLAKVGTYEIDIVNEKVNYTRTALTILGLDTDRQPTPEDFDELIHIDDLDRVNDAWEYAIVNNGNFDQEYRIYEQKKIRYIHGVGKPVVNDSGVLIKMVGSIQDITDRIEAEIATREVNERYAIAMKAAGIGSWDWWIQDEKLLWDDQMYTIFDVDKETATNTYADYEQRLHPDDKERVTEELNEVMSGDKEFFSSFRIIWRDGSIHYIQAASKTYYDANGEAYRMIGVNFDITKQKQAQRELSQNNKFLEDLIENLPVAVFTKDPIDGKFSRWNKASEEIFGIPSEDALGKSVFDLFPKDQADFFWKKDVEVVETEKRVDIPEEEVDTETKGTRILHTVKTPIQNEFGEIDTILCISDDITQSKEAQDKIRESEERNRALVTAIPDMMFRLNQQGTYLDFKAGAEETLVPPEDIIGSTLVDTPMPQDVKNRLTYFINEAIKTGSTQSLEYELLLPSGKVSSYEARISKSGEDEVICIVRDMTERHQAEKALAESMEKSRRYIELANDAILIADMETGIIIEANKKAEMLLGKPLNEITGMYHKELYPPELADDYTRSFMRNIPAKGGTLRNMKVVNTDGRMITVDISVTVVEISNRELMIGVFHDITDRVKAEQELIEAKEKAEQASIAKAQFLSTMSHEIRTPLNAVIGMTHLLLQENPKKEQLDNLNTLKFSTENLLVIINDILDFSKIDAGKIEFEEIDFDLVDLIKRIKGSLQQKADENRVDLKLMLDDDIPDFVIGDPVRINQVISNLMNNAIKFTHEGMVTAEARIRMIQPDALVMEIAVSDTGIGIGQDKLETIFDPFTQASSDTTRKYGGTGLGLAICSRLLELMGSNLEVESRPGVGSKFSFALHLGKSKRLRKNKTKEYKSGDFESLNGLRVLVVEDNEINQMVVQKFLKKWEVSTQIAENGEEALEKLKANEYDVILMDLQMPQMDGYTATKEIRKNKESDYTDIPIIAVTASAMLEIRDQVYAAGMNDYITKPFNPKDLYRKLAKYAGKQLEY